MSNIQEHIAKLEAAIKAQESMRDVLGDEAVDAAIDGLRSKIDLLRLQHEAPPIEKHLDLLEHSSLIREHQRFPDLEYMFKHTLTQDAAYMSLLVQTRKMLHKRVAEAIETTYPDRLNEFVGIIAEHYLRGESWEKAAEYLIRAGNDAVMRYSDIEARGYFDKALVALYHLPEATEILRARAETQLKLVHSSVVAESTDVSFRRLEEAEQTTRKLVEQTGQPDDRLLLARIQYEMGLAGFFTDSTSRALHYFDQVIHTASELGDASLLVYTANISGQIKTMRGNIPESIALLKLARDGFLAEGNTIEIVACRGCLGAAWAMVGRIEEGLAEAEAGLRIAEETNNLTGQSAGHLVLAMAQSFAGKDEEAVANFGEAIKFAHASQNPHYEYISLVEGWLSKERLGMYGELDRDMHHAEELVQQLGAELMAKEWRLAGQAAVCLRLGRVQEALERAQLVVEEAVSREGWYGAGCGHLIWAEALYATDPERWPEIEEHLVIALKLYDDGQIIMDGARAHVLWGRLCADRGDTACAEEHFDAARHVFEDAHADWEVKRLQAVMAS